MEVKVGENDFFALLSNFDLNCLPLEFSYRFENFRFELTNLN